MCRGFPHMKSKSGASLIKCHVLYRWDIDVYFDKCEFRSQCFEKCDMHNVSEECQDSLRLASMYRDVFCNSISHEVWTGFIFFMLERVFRFLILVVSSCCWLVDYFTKKQQQKIVFKFSQKKGERKRKKKHIVTFPDGDLTRKQRKPFWCAIWQNCLQTCSVL